jgi:DNA-binding NtrC family response regulator
MPLERILIVDDERLVQDSLSEFLRRRRYQVSTASNLAEATTQLARESFDLVFLDARLPDGDGHQFLDAVLGAGEQTIAVMITGHGTIENAVNCMRMGAFDYLLKPFSLSQIDVLLQKAESYRQLIHVNRYLNDPATDDSAILGNSASIQRLRQLVARVAPTDATVLITGENGTGKELVARDLFRRSTRRDHPYITVNCAALSETLIESELFGHERGAFTGAADRRTGRFELANRGTLLLDEISEIPLGLQAKLLRVLQEREFERVGGAKTIKINVRVLATSNRDLLSYVRDGHFREDLYYRLNVFPLAVPPLRERDDDVILLAEAFLQRFARKHRRTLTGFSTRAVAELRSYPWPGNVRELQNTIERAVILAEDGRPVSSSVLMLPKVHSPAPAVFRAQETGTAPPLEAEEAKSAVPPPSIPASPPESGKPPPVIDDLPPEEGDDETLAEPLHGGGPTAAVSDEDAVDDETVAAPTTPAPPPLRSLAEMEKDAIFRALRECEGNRTKAAEILGVTSRTMRNKLAAYRAAGELPAEFEHGD